MFKEGQTIIYSCVGVCKISKICENNITGVLRKYYVLNPVDSDKNVIYVPVDNEKLVSRMRTVPTKKELKVLLDAVNESAIEWIDNSLERNQVYRKILTDGDLKLNIRLLRTLHTHSSSLSQVGRHLVKSDEHIYKECTKLISGELASILQLEPSDVLQLVLCDDR